MRKRDLLGPWGEALAAAYLRKQGAQIVAMNYRTRLGEIDIIAREKGFIVFAEVKLRKTDAFGQAREFVDVRKQQRLRDAAAFWLSQTETELQPRFDVIEIYAPQGMQTPKPEIVRICDAFQ